MQKPAQKEFFLNKIRFHYEKFEIILKRPTMIVSVSLSPGLSVTVIPSVQSSDIKLESPLVYNEPVSESISKLLLFSPVSV